MKLSDLHRLTWSLAIRAWALAGVVSLLLSTVDAGAADPECIEGDPAYIEPFDPASGPWLRPKRDVSFCSSALPNYLSEIEMVCTVSVDGVPYGQATRKQRELIVLSNPAITAGPMEARCSFMGVDPEGQPVPIFSIVTNLFYEPVPIPEAPVPLEGAPPSP